MIRSAMRVQKTQVPASKRIIKYTTSGPLVSTFGKGLWMNLGFTNYDVFIVGGGGGQSGYAYPSAGATLYPGGGGGGASKRIQGLLKDLPVSVDVVVGPYGANSNTVNGTGARGGTSSFNGVEAPGGYGGVAGVGGRGSNPDGTPGPQGGKVKVGTASLITPGTSGWNDALQQSAGGGGGGGAYSATSSDNPSNKGQYGGQSAVSSSNWYTSPGEAPNYYPPIGLPGVAGGNGGGVNVAQVSGVVEYYGVRGGAVIIKIS